MLSGRVARSKRLVGLRERSQAAAAMAVAAMTSARLLRFTGPLEPNSCPAERRYRRTSTNMSQAMESRTSSVPWMRPCALPGCPGQCRDNRCRRVRRDPPRSLQWSAVRGVPARARYARAIDRCPALRKAPGQRSGSQPRLIWRWLVSPTRRAVRPLTGVGIGRALPVGKHAKRRVPALAIAEDLQVLEIAFASSTRVRQGLRLRSSTCIRLQNLGPPSAEPDERRPELRKGEAPASG